MDPKRKGEIAYEALKYRMSKDEISLNRETTKRELGNLSKALDVPESELAEFFETLFHELVGEVFRKSQTRQGEGKVEAEAPQKGN